jgi:L-fuculose-phosphate aldolase
VNERAVRQEICEIGRRLYEKGLVAGADGNISVRLPRERLLTTPSGCSKGFLKPEDLVVTDMAGKPMGGGKPSSEIMLHLAVYRKRTDVQAVVHAHPPTAVAFTVAGVSLEQCVMPEVLLYIGTLPTTRYATPSSPEGPEVIEELIGKHDALLLDRHGAVTVGKDVCQAWERMEKLEHFAQVVMRAKTLGAVRTLSEDELSRLVQTAARLGYKVDASVCRGAGSCGRRCACGAATAAVDTDAIAAAVVAEISKAAGVA